jgi:hypothetical protein
MASEGKTFSNDHEFASEQGQKGGATQPEEVYKRESRTMSLERGWILVTDVFVFSL